MFFWFLGALFLLLPVACCLEWRRRRRVAAAIVARGGTVLRIELDMASEPQRTVRYVAASGDVREAIVSTRGACEILDDRPLQDILRAECRRHGQCGPEMIREILVASEAIKLPGFKAYCEIVLKLAKGEATSVMLREGEDDERRRFAAILQSVEVASIPAIERGGTGSPLDLVAGGKGVMVAWRVEGDSPKRTLTLSAVPPEPDRATPTT